jgi:hypothetical protein
MTPGLAKKPRVVRSLRLTTVLLTLSLTTTAPFALADVRTEAAASQATEKAEKDFVAAKYAAGIAKLQHALRACGGKKCSDEVRAGLLRDIGAHLIRQGDRSGAQKSWASALKLVPSLTLSATYDSPDVRSAFDEAKGAGGGAAPSGAGTSPAGGAGGGGSASGAAGAGGSSGASTSATGATSQVGEPTAKGKGPGGAGTEGESKPSSGEEAEAGPRKFRRAWLGIAGTLELGHLPAAQDVCPFDPRTNQPFNTDDFYCTQQNGADFPSRNPADLTNGALQRGKAGNVADQIALGNLRALVSFDYAITQNILVGARAGVAFFVYPGGSPTLTAQETSGAAFNDGKAFSATRLHLEARATYLFGSDPFAQNAIAPMVFAGGGVGEFDQHTSDTITLASGSSGTVNIWRTAGPLFFMLGGGVRWSLADNLALTGAIRANFAVMPVFMPTAGPEIGLQVGL